MADKEKIKHEVFRTPLYVYENLYNKFPEWFVGRCLEPSAGDGRIIKFILNKKNTNQHMIIDIRESEQVNWKKNKLYTQLGKENCIVGDFLETSLPKVFDLIITNPPFSLAQSFVIHGLKSLKKDGVFCLLQRANWVGTIERSKWFKESQNLYKVVVVPKRITFEIDGKPNNKADTYEYCWFCFKRGKHIPTIDWLF